MPPTRSVLAALLGLAAGACSQAPDVYPSLAPRPIERIASQPPATPPPVAATVDPAFEARVREQQAKVDAAASAFDAELARARETAGRPGAATAGSEGWIAAQQALSALDSRRGPTGAALAELDAMRLEAAQRAEPVDTRTLEEAFARARSIDEAQRAAVAELGKTLPSQ